ncbi:MAG TPA: tetratricopeptide repeat protein [Polyangiaceae bacterium]|nr:tetratricopeptide repeat protein [Polyangiaceae bacterium]
MRRIEIWVCASLLGLPATVCAQNAGNHNQATAEALFGEGRSLAAKGRYAEACPKFEASQQLDPGLGTVLNLADCYEKLGKTASAWAEYRDAIPLARASGSKVRLDLATSRAAALESHLSRLTIRASAAASSVHGLEIRRDGTAVLQAELDSALPVDPGPHTVEASAPGKQPWSTTVQIGADAPNAVVEVPALAETASAKPVVAATPVESKAHKPGEPAAEREGSPQRTVALVVGAVGIAGLGLGTAFGVLAKNNWSDAKAKCSNYPSACSPQGVDLNSTASSQATVSTIAFIAGGAALATGAVLWFTASSKSTNHSVALGVGPGAAFVTGSFQ